MADQKTTIDKVLILMPDSHLGNLVVALPAIVAVRDHFQAAAHYFVFDDAFREIVEPLLDHRQTLFYPRRMANEGSVLARMFVYFRFLLRIKKIHPELTIDLDGGSTSSILTQVARAARSFSRASAERPDVYTRTVAPPSGSHKFFQYAVVTTAAGAPVDDGVFHFQATEEKRQAVRQKLHDAGIDPARPLVCLHVGGGRKQKLWPVEHFAELASRLLDQGHQVLFFGGEREREKNKAVIARLSQSVANLAGTLTLGEQLALLDEKRIFIGSDNGLIHLAAAGGAAVAALFSYADEREWGPRSERAIVLRGQERCPDCNPKNCVDPRCITTLPVDRVMEAIAGWLAPSSAVP